MRGRVKAVFMVSAKFEDILYRARFRYRVKATITARLS